MCIYYIVLHVVVISNLQKFLKWFYGNVKTIKHQSWKTYDYRYHLSNNDIFHSVGISMLNPLEILPVLSGLFIPSCLIT